MGNRQNRHFIGNKIQTDSKYTKRCSTKLTTREMQMYTDTILHLFEWEKGGRKER